MQKFGGRLAAKLINSERLFAVSSYQRFGVLSRLRHQSQGRQPFHTAHSFPRLQKPVSVVRDLQPHQVTGSIKSAYQPKSSRNLLVELADGQRYEFPLVWLRDNCQCSKCFHPGSYSRIHDWERFNPDSIVIQNCSISDDGTQVNVTWHDGHQSQFSATWLEDRNFTKQNTQEYLEEWYRPKPRLWKKHEFGEILKSFEFEDVISKDEALQAWIESLIRYGVVMIRNAPLTEQECRKLANRVGFIRKTHYGEEFIVKSKEGTTNVAYLSTPLQMHTDLPYYDYKPGCNLLHCLVQSRSHGGQNLIADAFAVADFLRREHPEDFRLLSEILVNWTDIGVDEGGEFHSIYRAPVICLDREGKLERINHSVPQRDSFFNIPLDQVEPWYRAMAHFVRILHREAVEFKTAPGDILTFSNIRMVHGRTGYTDTEANTRHIVGAYLDWDEIYSRLRVLKGKGAHR